MQNYSGTRLPTVNHRPFLSDFFLRKGAVCTQAICTAHPTMLRRRTRTTCHVSRQIHTNKKSTWRRRWKTSQSPHLKTQHVVTCCERLHTSANIAQQETALLGPTMLRVVASVCTGLKVDETVEFTNTAMALLCKPKYRCWAFSHFAVVFLKHR